MIYAFQQSYVNDQFVDNILMEIDNTSNQIPLYKSESTTETIYADRFLKFISEEQIIIPQFNTNIQIDKIQKFKHLTNINCNFFNTYISNIKLIKFVICGENYIFYMDIKWTKSK